MRGIYKIKIIFILLLPFYSCIESKLEKALQQAGDNRPELEKVLSYYGKEKKDALKLKAVKFLIENMDAHYSFQSDALTEYYLRMDSIFRLNSPDVRITNEQDSLLKLLERPHSYPKIIPDLKAVTADFLIENIELAFEAWKSPWANNLNFDDFCEYLLPYRAGIEQAASWRQPYKSTFLPLLKPYYETFCRLDSAQQFGYEKIGLATIPEEEKYHCLPEDLFSAVSEFTICGWINPHERRTFARFFDCGEGESCYICFIPYDNFQKASLRFQIQKFHEQQIETDAPPLNQWSHIAVTFSNNHISLYVNGMLIETKPFNIDPKRLICNYLGKSQYANDPYLHGEINHFQVYNKQLNPKEINNLAAKKQAKTYAFSGLLIQKDFESPDSEFKTLPYNMFSSATKFWSEEDILQYMVERIRAFYSRILYHDSYIPGGYNPLLLMNLKRGSCNDYSLLGTHIFRSIGFPSAIDFSQQAGHDWNVLVVGGKNYDCSFIDDNDTIGKHIKGYAKIIPDRMSKVFRHTFAKQKDTPAMSGSKEDFPGLFTNPCLKDVTGLYLDCMDVSIKLDNKLPTGQQFVYLHTFQREWIPVHWGKHKNGKALFTKMGKDVVYLPACYHHNRIYPAAYPFILTREGKVVTLKPDIGNTQRLVLTRKFPEKEVHKKDRLSGTKFQVAQKADFSDAQTIHTVNKRPPVCYSKVSVTLEKPYRYFRFVAPPDSWGGEMAEIEVFGEDSRKIQWQKVIGNGDSPLDRTPNSVFDGNPLTSYWCHQQNDGWVGLDFGRPVNICSFRFLPLNDDNFIRENELYELFYWDGKWISLGRQTGTSKQYLEYGNAPRNALFWLRNLTKGKEERIFTYEDGKQIWW
jgi:hypothetical protein